MPDETCPVCAHPTPGGLICGACLKRAPYFDATQAIWRYGFPLDRLIQSLKYGHRLTTIGFFGRALAGAPQMPLSQRPDLILAVPLAPARLRQRGFNQSVEIARRLARQMKVPLDLSHVHRQRNTSPQASLPWKERVKNVRDAFECTINLTGRRVLVIDDVMTTGATLNELARTLKLHGAIWVENLVLARALRD